MEVVPQLFIVVFVQHQVGIDLLSPLPRKFLQKFLLTKNGSTSVLKLEPVQNPANCDRRKKQGHIVAFAYPELKFQSSFFSIFLSFFFF